MQKFILMLRCSYWILLACVSFVGIGRAQLPQKHAVEDTSAIAYINHVKISRGEYARELDRNMIQLEAATQSAEPTAKDLLTARQTAWDYLLTRALVRADADRLGVHPTRESVFDDLLHDPPPFLRKQFIDSLGNFHAREFEQAMKDPKNDSIIQNGVIAPALEIKRFQDWQAIMNSAVLITDPQLREAFDALHSHADAEILQITPIDSLSSVLPKITPEEISSYYQSHNFLFQHPQQRRMDFVLFGTQISHQDSIEFKQKISIVATKSGASKDSWGRAVEALTTNDPDARFVEDHPLNWSELSDTLSEDQLRHLKPGAILTTFTPFGARITKVTQIHHGTQTSFHTRHILISFEDHDRDSAKLLATALYNQLKGGADFSKLATLFSGDPASAKRAGDLGWVKKGVFVKEFEAVALKAKIGVVQPPIASEYGYHIIEVLARTDLEFEGEAMEFTLSKEKALRSAQAQAKSFYIDAEKFGFDTAASANQYSVIRNIPQSNRGIPIFGDVSFSRAIGNAKLQSTLPPFFSESQHVMVVARVSKIEPAGASELTDVTPEIRLRLAKRSWVGSVEPQASEVREAVIKSNQFEAVPAPNVRIQKMKLSFGPQQVLPGAGAEFAVNAAAFSLADGAISPIIRGENGFYIVKLIKKYVATDADFEKGKSELRDRMLKDRQLKLTAQWVENAKANAEIIDLRSEDE